MADPGVCVHKVARDTSGPGQAGLGGWGVSLKKWSWAGLLGHECQAKKLRLYQADHRGTPEGSEQSSLLIDSSLEHSECSLDSGLGNELVCRRL